MRLINYLINFKTIFVLLFLLFGIIIGQQALAQAYNCNSSSAPWHQDRNTGMFACMKNINKNKYTTVDAVTKDQVKYYAERNKNACYEKYRKNDCAVCDNALEQCARLADCDNFASDGYSCTSNKSHLDGYDCIRYHCTGSNNNVCCRKTPITPVDNTPITPVVNTVPKPKTYTLKIDDCCGSIVPPIPRDKTTGKLLRDSDGHIIGYTLNDVVQTAINVYECILCIVGALIFIMFVVGATVMIISGGSSEKVALGKKIIVSAVVGGVLALSTYMIIYWTIKAVGGNLISPYGEGSEAGHLNIDKGIEMIK